MNIIELPEHINYIGAFLTYRCKMGCSYCINKYECLEDVNEMDSTDWIEGLRRFRTKEDLPITLQGGEPTMHPGFYHIAVELNSLNRSLDLLTNGQFHVYEFAKRIPPHIFNRRAHYASIRFSYHEKTSEYDLLTIVEILQKAGYNVGIWGLDYPEKGWKENNRGMKEECDKLGIDFRLKEFLSEEHGTYKYEDSYQKVKKMEVMCQASEILISPAGFLFRCHADLYRNRNPYAHILDENIRIPLFETCKNYGHCNPCDVKLKTNRFQQFGHCAVEIKGRGGEVK